MREGRTFAVLILTHGRPHNVRSLSLLRESGYTGDTYFVIDNEDAQGDEYRRTYGAEWVVEFDKAAIAQTFDTADTSNDRRAIVYARNAAFGIARELGLDYFLQLDDDYHSFRLRRVIDGVLREARLPRDIDLVFDLMLDFLDDTGAATVAFAQGGDQIGGIKGGNFKQGIVRKTMNTFFCRTDRPVGFLGRLNEDVSAYVVHGSRGHLFFGVMRLQVEQTPTQHAEGGMTDTYRDGGTYLKSFYTVMMAPSCVTVQPMGGPVAPRFHHRVSWGNAVPKIINERYRKAS